MNVPSRIQTIAQLLRLFEEVRARSPDQRRSEPSEDLKRVRSGEISTEQYLMRRFEMSLKKLEPYLDREELEYVRQACVEYLEDDLMHSGLFQMMKTRLRNDPQSSNTPQGEAAVNQKKSTAKKNEGAVGSEDLQALKRGEITVDEYVDRRFERQIKLLNLDRLLTKEELEKMRQIFREDFAESPLVAHYIDAMTGKSGKGSE